MSDVRELVCELALRALEQQERELSELRARTNTIIAAAALIASFLGAAAIREHGGLSTWAIVALAVLVLNGALSLVVLWPRTVGFVFDARESYAELEPLLEDAAEAQLRVAYGARDQYEFNKRTIDRLELAFQAAVLTLGVQAFLLGARPGGSLMAMADKPKPPSKPTPPDKVKPLPQSVFIMEKRGSMKRPKGDKK